MFESIPVKHKGRSTDTQGYRRGSEETISTAAHSESWLALAQKPNGRVICIWDSDPGQASYQLFEFELGNVP